MFPLAAASAHSMDLESVAGGTFTYTPLSNLTLSPNTPYFIVLTAGITIANGAYEWPIQAPTSKL